MTAPYLIGDERAFQDFLTNSNAQNVQSEQVQITPIINNSATSPSGGLSAHTAFGGSVVLRSSTTAASAAIGATETILLNMPIVPAPAATSTVAGTLQVGTKVRIVAEGTCTSSNADTATFTIYQGTTGTKSDTSVATASVTTAGSGTGIAFKAVIEFTVRTLGASGTAAGSLAVMNTGITGIAAVTNTVVPFTSTTLGSPTATFLSVSYVSAATSATTFQDVSIEVIQ